mmetsp:Transcript_67954/g.125339  ORF Transcript_67954/g.125339 Transcript_67954/m.125339 type:complete len:115 (-) Transcript_67954:3-347(-)
MGQLVIKLWLLGPIASADLENFGQRRSVTVSSSTIMGSKINCCQQSLGVAQIQVLIGALRCTTLRYRNLCRKTLVFLARQDDCPCIDVNEMGIWRGHPYTNQFIHASSSSSAAS